MTSKSKKILCEISAGELLDKISILEIKLKEVKDKSDQEEIKKEYTMLKEIQNSSLEANDKIDNLFKSLKEVNSELWKSEDVTRMCEKNKDFGEKFIKTSRSIYFTNDKRARIKSEINKILGSNIREVKQHPDYES
tara:strand:- start:401 stop:808 length:408 start_codon:yes stop_codon:yes gene_type:complete